MKRESAEEFTDALGQVFSGAVRLAEVASDIGIPKALGLTPEQWAQRRLAGRLQLEREERQKVVAANPTKSSRQLSEALGVSHQTIVNDRETVKNLTARRMETESGEGATVKNLTGRNRTALITSEHNDWETPQDLFDTLDAEFGFDLDVCATDETAKCERYFTPEEDGLAQEWHGTCWMNPPYGDAIATWVAKAAESARSGATVVCLVPARVDTGWWWDYCRRGEIRFLRGRLRFGDGSASAPFPSAVVVLGRRARVIWWER